MSPRLLLILPLLIVLSGCANKTERVETASKAFVHVEAEGASNTPRARDLPRFDWTTCNSTVYANDGTLQWTNLAAAGTANCRLAERVISAFGDHTLRGVLGDVDGCGSGVCQDDEVEDAVIDGYRCHIYDAFSDVTESSEVVCRRREAVVAAFTTDFS